MQSPSLSGALREPPKRQLARWHERWCRKACQGELHWLSASQAFQHHRSCEVVVLMLGVLQNERFARSIRQKCAKTSSKMSVSQSLRKAFRERFGSPQKPQKKPKPGGVGTQRNSAQISATQRTSSVHQVDATINLGIHVIRSALSIDLLFSSP